MDAVGLALAGAIPVERRNQDPFIAAAASSAAGRAHAAGGAAAWGGKVYNGFGFTVSAQNQYSLGIDVYDPAADAWSTVTAGGGGDARRGPATAITSAGKMYFFGGYSPQGSVYMTDYVGYDLVANAWIPPAAMPQRWLDWSPATVAIGTDIYLFGGNWQFDGIARVYRFNSLTGTFTAMANLPANGSYGLSATVFAGKVIITAGSYSSTALNNTWIYDPATNTYANGANQLRSGTGQKLVTLRDRVMQLCTNGSSTNVTFMYDPVANTWAPSTVTTPQGLNLTSELTFAVAPNDTDVLIGGSTDPTFFTLNYRWKAWVPQEFIATLNALKGWLAVRS